MNVIESLISTMFAKPNYLYDQLTLLECDKTVFSAWSLGSSANFDAISRFEI